MSTPQDEKPQIQVTADEDWKSQVKAEDARLDAERAASAPPPPPEQPDAESASFDASQLPPASFSMLVQMFSTQAVVALGMIPDPAGKQQQNLALARHFIDLLAVLEDKCRGNLADAESQLLENSLHELRMAYIELSKRST